MLAGTWLVVDTYPLPTYWATSLYGSQEVEGRGGSHLLILWCAQCRGTRRWIQDGESPPRCDQKMAAPFSFYLLGSLKACCLVCRKRICIQYDQYKGADPIFKLSQWSYCVQIWFAQRKQSDLGSRLSN